MSHTASEITAKTISFTKHQLEQLEDIVHELNNKKLCASIVRARKEIAAGKGIPWEQVRRELKLKRK